METQREIVIGVTGSIAIYKTCELVRSLVKKNFSVWVVMSDHAAKFIDKNMFQALTSHPVSVGSFDGNMIHIELKNRAAVYAVVPATANIISKFANGIADDIVSTTYLAVRSPVLIAPAMNPNMYSHPAFQRNLEQIKKDGVVIMNVQEGEVVCSDVGEGKMADITMIEKKIIELYHSTSI